MELFAKHLVKHYFLVHLWNVSEEFSIWFSGLSQGHPCRVGSHQPISWGPEKKAEEGQIHSTLLSGTSVFSCPDFPDLKLADSRSWHLSASVNVWVNCYNNSLISIYPIGSVSLGTLTIQVVSIYFQHSMAWKSTTAPPPTCLPHTTNGNRGEKNSLLGWEWKRKILPPSLCKLTDFLLFIAHQVADGNGRGLSFHKNWRWDSKFSPWVTVVRGCFTALEKMRLLYILCYYLVSGFLAWLSLWSMIGTSCQYNSPDLPENTLDCVLPTFSFHSVSLLRWSHSWCSCSVMVLFLQMVTHFPLIYRQK